MTHLIELLALVPVVIVAYLFCAHEMRERDKLTDEERAELQDREAW